jgi:hypothetical protein
MREPFFTETLQIGIVVRDLETAMGRYVDDYGIEPWDIHEFNAGNGEDLHDEAVLSGTFSGIRVAYLPTEQDLGVIVEIFSRDPAPEQKPDAT